MPLDGVAVPPPPVVKPDEIWSGSPNVLIDGVQFTIGWQHWPERKGGPGFVTARRGALGTFKIVERYPLTDDGWARAWTALVALDPAAAEKVLRVLARRAEEDSGFAERKKLDARSLGYLPRVIFVGGYLSGWTLAAGQWHELRFLEDRLSVFEPGSLTALAEFSYADLQAVEVEGPGLVRKWSPVQQAMLTEAFGLTGALIAYANTRIKTFVRIQTADSELFFLHTTLLPDDLRIHLSRAIGAVRESKAPAVTSGGSGNPAGRESLVDELSRLAGLFDSGLLTAEEFSQLKARLIQGH